MGPDVMDFIPQIRQNKILYVRIQFGLGVRTVIYKSQIFILRLPRTPPFLSRSAQDCFVDDAI
jgi:hypothetical protein